MKNNYFDKIGRKLVNLLLVYMIVAFVGCAGGGDDDDGNSAGETIETNPDGIELFLFHDRRADGNDYFYASVEWESTMYASNLDVSSIIVDDPEGDILCTMGEMNFFEDENFGYDYYDQGLLTVGTYRATVVVEDKIYILTKSQEDIIDIPVVDIGTISPADDAIIDTSTPTFSWEPVSYADVDLYYRITIYDSNGNQIKKSRRIKDMTTYTVDAGLLLNGRSYSWAVDVQDDSDWIGIQNRSRSSYVTFTVDMP